jgi:regulator of protease activity HflC (stomatin/prohibitin superfamily)
MKGLHSMSITSDLLPGLDSKSDINEKQGFVFPRWMGPMAIVLHVLLVILLIGNIFSLMSVGIAGGNVLGSLILEGFGILICCAIQSAYIIQSPGQATVLQFFGQYMGTVRQSGLSLALPFLSKRKVSVKTENFETPVAKVNDADGNPIETSAIVVWRLKDTAKAIYGVQNHEQYLRTQAEAAVRHVASQHPYDTTDQGATSLLKDAEIVNAELAQEVTLRAEAAGIDIIEVRINNLSYSVEIAQAMLQRQQASAIISARRKIVEGAVGIVEDAAEALSKKHDFSDEKKAALVSDLLVVLVSESKVSPVLNVGKSTR